MSKPVLLDAFCGAGGATAGYQRAGFHVVGVDIAPQPNYCGDEFVQTDALEFLAGDLSRFAAVHASPPCHDMTSLNPHPDGTGWMLAATVDVLSQAPRPWVVENVVGPDVRMAGWWFVLCGSMFGLRVRRHRRFGSSHLMLPPACRHAEQGRPWTITGNGGGCDRAADGTGHSRKPNAREFWRYMDMPWMEGKPPYGVAQAIPPSYTEWIGNELMRVLEHAA